MPEKRLPQTKGTERRASEAGVLVSTVRSRGRSSAACLRGKLPETELTWNGEERRKQA